jgi:hypothetical protein
MNKETKLEIESILFRNGVVQSDLSRIFELINMNTLDELNDYFKKLSKMRATKDEQERERLKYELDHYFK